MAHRWWRVHAMVTGAVALLAACSAPAPRSPGVTNYGGAVDAAPPIDAGIAADLDGDGIPDRDDLCPEQPMANSAGCDLERQRGCPDDCQPPLVVP